MELPFDLVDRPEMDCGLELKFGVGGWRSISLFGDGAFSENDEGVTAP
jgi:hypothetical protein